MKALMDWVQSQVVERFPQYPVAVERADGDDETVCVRVFAVPQNLIDVVEEFVWALEGRVPGVTGAILMPLVKSVDVTRSYYPTEWATSLSRAATAHQVVDDAVARRAKASADADAQSLARVLVDRFLSVRTTWEGTWERFSGRLTDGGSVNSTQALAGMLVDRLPPMRDMTAKNWLLTTEFVSRESMKATSETGGVRFLEAA